MQVTRQWSSFCCLLERVKRWVYTPSLEGGGGEITASVFAARQPMPPINQWVLLHPIPLSPSSPSLPLSLPPLTGGGLSWQCSAGEGRTSYGGKSKTGEEREIRGRGGA